MNRMPGILKHLLPALLFCLLCTGMAAAQDQRPMDILFDAADTNHNGLLDEQEWHTYLQVRFEKLDASHDGNLSRAELEQAKSTLRQTFRERMQNRRNGAQ